MTRRKVKPETTEPTGGATAVEPAASAEESVRPDSSDPGAEALATTDQESATKPYGPNPFGVRADVVAGVRLQEDKRYRQMQLSFDTKPSDAVRHAVRDAGFQWRSQEQVWSKRIDPDQGWRTRAGAEELFDQVTTLIPTEQRHGHSIG